MNTILFIAFPETHLLDLSGPAQVFYEAKELGAQLKIKYGMVGASSGVKMAEGLTLAGLERYDSFNLSLGDLIFIPGIHYSQWSNASFMEHCKPFFEWLRQKKNEGIQICSVCTGAYILGEAELLNGIQCTTHWKRIEDFEQRYPDAIVERDRLFLMDQNIYTSAGISSGIDLALFITEKLYGAKMSIDVAREMVVYLRRTDSDHQLSEFLSHRNHINTQIHDAQTYIANNLNKQVSIAGIAEAVHMSERNLTRQFKRITGLTIGAYTDQLKAKHAKRLLEEGHKVDSVAEQCGYTTSNQLRSLLQKVFKKLPNQLR